MALGSCHTCIKYVMFAFNFLFWLLGCAMLGVGIWMLVDPNIGEYVGTSEKFDFIYTGAYILVAIGALIMVIGFLGCCGAIRESQCMLGLFFALLFIIFAVLLGAGIWAIIAKDTVRNLVETVLKEQVDEACSLKDPKERSINFMHNIQKKFDCCGVNGYTDYKPLEHCKLSKETPCTPLNFDKDGCLDKLGAWMEDNILIIAGVAIGIAVILIMGMIFSIVLCCAIRDIQA